MFGMNIAIRTASPEDRDEWVRLRWELWPDCPAERHSLEMVQILGLPGMVALAFVDQKLTGFAEVSVRSDHVEGTVSSPVPYLEGWYVQPAHRGQGVGRALISYVEQWARSNGYSEIASDAEIQNSRSIRLHSRLGFREVSRTVHFVKTLGNQTAEQTRCSEPGETAVVDNRGSAAPL